MSVSVHPLLRAGADGIARPRPGIDPLRSRPPGVMRKLKEEVMDRNLALAQVVVLVFLATTSIVPAQAQYATAKEARAMLDKAVVALKQDKQKAIEMFNKGEGGFR